MLITIAKLLSIAVLLPDFSALGPGGPERLSYGRSVNYDTVVIPKYQYCTQKVFFAIPLAEDPSPVPPSATLEDRHQVMPENLHQVEAATLEILEWTRTAR